MADEQRDVLAPFPQGGQEDRDDVQAVVQVFPESALADHLHEIRVGGGDDADVDTDRPVVSDALELAFLQHPQQLRLQGGAHGADLVEKQRPLVRRLQAALPGRDGVGVGAADVSEELGLEQGLGHRAAVQGDEPMAAPGAVVVYRLGRELLAGARLPGDEDRARARGHRLQQVEQLAHPRTAPHEALEAVALLDLRPQPGVLGPEAALLEGGPHHVQQLAELERLGDEVRRPALDRGHRVGDGAEAGHDDADDVGIPFEGGVEHRGAVDARQPQIRQHDVEGALGQALDRRLSVVDLDHPVALVGEPLGGDLAQRGLVLHQQHRDLAFSHGRRPLSTPLGGGDAGEDRLMEGSSVADTILEPVWEWKRRRDRAGRNASVCHDWR